MDKKAKNILFKTYWSSKGWKEEPVTAPDDFIYAKEKGLMFDPLTISHDDCVKQIIEIVNSISLEQVVKAFLSSLSTRRLDWRSGIASYYIAKLITPHKYTPVESGYFYENGKVVAISYTCGICSNLRYGVIGNERTVIIEILACIGVLKPMSYDRAIRGKHDWTFVEYWRGEDGYDDETVKKYFGKYL